MSAITEQQEISKRNIKQSKAELEAVETELGDLKEKMETLLKERECYETDKNLLHDKLKD